MKFKLPKKKFKLTFLNTPNSIHFDKIVCVVNSILLLFNLYNYF